MDLEPQSFFCVLRPDSRRIGTSSSILSGSSWAYSMADQTISAPPWTPGGSHLSASASYLHELVALFAGDNEVIPELVLGLWILDDGELI